MKIRWLFILCCIFATDLAFSQGTAINTSGSAADNSAILDVNSSSKGILISRMTTSQRNAIASPAQSLLIFNTTTQCFEYFDNTIWQKMYCSCMPPTSPNALAGSGSAMTQFTANWDSVPNVTGYYLDVATDAGFMSLVSGYSNKNVNKVISYNVTGLTCNTTYYYRVRAYNSCSPGANSNPIACSTSSSCGPCGVPFTDARDGKTYSTVLIGSQCWMGQNLDVGTRINGTLEQGNNSVLEKYCYNDNPAECTVYGGLYQWGEAVQYLNGASNSTSWSPAPGGYVVGICPVGWHLPSSADWLIMYAFLGGQDVSGGKLKEAGLTHWESPNTGATNSSGFTALPGGYRYSDGSFYDIGFFSYFRSAINIDSYNATLHYFTSYDAEGYNWDAEKLYGASIRCIRN